MISDRVTIPLEPPAPRRLANDLPLDGDLEAQKDILWDFTDDGLPTWKKRKDESTQLTEALRKVWEERGDYSKLTIESIERNAGKSNEKTVNEKKPSNLNEDEVRSSSLTLEELWEMRMRMAQQLGNMAGELNTGLDLLNTILGPLAPEAVDASSLPLPAGGIAPAILSSEHLPPAPEPTMVIDAGVSLMRKQRATQNAAQLLKRTAKELGQEAQRSQEHWNALLKLREASWKMRPRGAKPGADLSLMGKGAERAAKEIGIAFATTEAAEELRASSFASLEHTSQEDTEAPTLSLKFPPRRPRRRLCISLVFSDDRIERFSPLSLESARTGPVPFEEDLFLARAEVLEEEIFGELSSEAQLIDTYRVTISESSVIVSEIGGCREIRFDMLERTASKTYSETASPYAQLLSSAMRLLMISIYRFRRSCAVGPSTRARPSQPKILEPVLNFMAFYFCTNYLRRLFTQAFSSLKSTQLDVELEFDPILESAEEILSTLIGSGGTSPSSVEIGSIATLRIEGRRSVSFTIAYPACISLWLDDRSIVIGPERLSEQVMQEVVQSITLKLRELIHDSKIKTRKVPDGLICESEFIKFFLIPSFRFEDGLKIDVEQIGRFPGLKNQELDSISCFRGQIGLIGWVEELKNFMLRSL